MKIEKEIDEILNEICFARIPYEIRMEMCEAVVKAARERRRNDGQD